MHIKLVLNLSVYINGNTIIVLIILYGINEIINKK
jgi:hypothetical protein